MSFITREIAAKEYALVMARNDSELNHFYAIGFEIYAHLEILGDLRLSVSLNDFRADVIVPKAIHDLKKAVAACIELGEEQAGNEFTSKAIELAKKLINCEGK